MAQSIRNLELGSRVKDDRGNVFKVIAHNHYEANETVLWSESPMRASRMSSNNYATSDVDYFLNNDYPKILSSQLNASVKSTPITIFEKTSNYQGRFTEISRKYFLLGIAEYCYDANVEDPAEHGKKMPYFDTLHSDKTKRIVYNSDGSPVSHWTRSALKSVENFFTVQESGWIGNSLLSYTHYIVPAFAVSNILVSDTVQDGCYTFIFNQPPVISTIANIKGNYGMPTEIGYIATDVDDSSLLHYFSIDNGTNWIEVKPSKVGSNYKFSHLFNELGNYNCRIKVVDSANNQAVSNMFIVGVNSVAPTVSIISVVDRVVTFKVNCITEAVTKVEILINGVVKRTITSGFDFNLTHEIDRTHLNLGANAIQIKATSSANLIGIRGLEANKKAYNLPPVGTKVVIGNYDYSIVSATQNGTNQTYTLNKNLVSNVSAGNLIQVLQDYVGVKCALSNTSTDKEYKDMKLIKTKVLKGAFSGYVEEKYELDGEGRYSTVKLDLQRFNNDVASELIELQQAFDYLED